MGTSHINIKLPFKESPKGYYFDSNLTTKDAIKSDILHILITKKGERFFDPKFGTRLYEYLFEPNDSITINDIVREANASLSYCLPNIEILSIEVTPLDNRVNLKIIAVDTDDVYMDNIQIEVEI